MLATKLSFEELVRVLLDRLAEMESREADLCSRLEACIKACEETILQLRNWVTDNAFPDEATEIYFFKSVKPVIMARYIYYRKIYRLHISYFKGSGLLEKEKLNQVLQEIASFFEDNKTFWDYHRTGDTHYDGLYFVRGKHDWKICPDPYNFDIIFSTSEDGKLAELLAHELLLAHVDRLLNPPPLREINVACSQPSPTLQCTATVTNIVELGYALYASGFFNRGNASIKEIMDFLSNALQVNLHKYYDTFVQIRERKINPTKYLDELKNNLAKYIDKGNL